MSLIELQRSFFVAVTGDGAVQENDRSFGSGPGLAIYRTAYRARLDECLRENFEKCWSWIGDEAFEAAASRHFAVHPPHSWTLDDAGVNFTETLAIQFPDDPEVEELAWLEWEMQRSFTCADVRAVDAGDFAGLTAGYDDERWMRMRLSIAPGLQMREVVTDCAAIWNAIEHEQAMPDPLLLPRPATIAVWRKGLRPAFRVLDRDEAAQLRSMQGGGSFGDLCETLIEQYGAEDGMAMAGAMLANWVGESMVVGISEP